MDSYVTILLQLTLFIALFTTTIKEGAAVTQPNPNCNTTCGNLTIPFPFGTTPDCYLDDSFLITCNSTADNRPQPFLRKGNIPVLNISLDGQMQVSPRVSRVCYNESGLPIPGSGKIFPLSLSKFHFSTRNKFTAVGCDTFARISGESNGQNYTTGCISGCTRVDSVTNGTCSGIGCCQSLIPEGITDFSVAIGRIGSINRSAVLDFNPCSYAFIVEEESFNFSSLDLMDLRGKENFPAVLDWAVGNETCEDAKKNQSSYACRALESRCVARSNGQGYFCNCSKGFDGNPYLFYGCQDIDECTISNPCDSDTEKCTNTPGSFSCSCQEGYEDDGTGCQKKDKEKATTLLYISLGISISLLFLVVGSSWICWLLNKRKHMKQRDKFFQQNGGFLLKQQLSKQEGSVETVRIFTAEDLKKATNNYDELRIIGQGGFGTVYKGVLPDNREVAIKKSKISDQSQIEQFINEVVILSKINHRNVVKLLGCCLETEVPLLVYEFISNGTLSDHIHNENHASSLSWEMRLKIAAEAAGALAYLHSATSTPIIHRDIKSTNILLDDTYTTKVSDFGASRLIPVNQTQLTTLVQGTFGYLDPEYFHSSQLTEKSDVYSFGVLLAELLTGEKSLSFDRSEENRNLAMYFVSSMKEDRLLEIIEDRLVQEGKFEQLQEVAMLVKRCLRLKGEERPSMKEVAMELEGLIRMMEKHPWVDIDLNTEETKHLLNQIEHSDAYDGFVGSSNDCSTSAGYDSMRDQLMVPVEFR